MRAKTTIALSATDYTSLSNCLHIFCILMPIFYLHLLLRQSLLFLASYFILGGSDIEDEIFIYQGSLSCWLIIKISGVSFYTPLRFLYEHDNSKCWLLHCCLNLCLFNNPNIAHEYLNQHVTKSVKKSQVAVHCEKTRFFLSICIRCRAHEFSQ